MQFKKKIIILCLFFLICIFHFTQKIYSRNIIFSFWEPKDKMPGFLKLCIKTWEKFLPEYEIIILDYKTTKYYLGETLFSKIICKNMSLMLQADAIRIAILNKFGGIWMDADTIILNKEFLKKFRNSDLAMVGDKKINFHYISFISASKNSSILHKWLKQIIFNVKNYKNILLNQKNTINWKNSWKKVNSWHYLGNGIIDPILSNVTDEGFLCVDSNEINVFPEIKFFQNSSLHEFYLYRSFYFQNRDPTIILNDTKGLIFLHNNWTPLVYKNMSEKDFLKQDILLSKLLLQLLNPKI